MQQSVVSNTAQSMSPVVNIRSTIMSGDAVPRSALRRQVERALQYLHLRITMAHLFVPTHPFTKAATGATARAAAECRYRTRVAQTLAGVLAAVGLPETIMLLAKPG
jgi:hypothetical protein